MTLAADYEACRALVRADDRDHYLAALFAPAPLRHHLFALAAFNTELGRIADHVREPMLGEVRLQWWRDAIDGVAAGEAARSPVANAFVTTVRQCGLPSDVLHALMDARAFDFYREPMATLAQLERYLDGTAVSLARLAVKILGGGASPEMARAVAHAGRAYASAGLLRSFAPNAARGRIYLPPLDVLTRHGADAATVTSGTATPHLLAALREMRDLARFHLTEANELLALLPKKVLPAFLPLRLVPDYLARMERGDYDPFHTLVEMPPWKKPWLLWRAAR